MMTVYFLRHWIWNASIPVTSERSCNPDIPTSTAAGNGALWRNGASGLLRTNFRNKQGASMGSANAAQDATDAGASPISGSGTTGMPKAGVANGRDQQQGASGSGRSVVAAAPRGVGDQGVAPPGFFGLQPEATRIVTPPPQRHPKHLVEVMSIHDQVHPLRPCSY